MILSLDKNQVANFEGSYKYDKKVLAFIDKNKKNVTSIIEREKFKGVFEIPEYERLFSLSGSFKVISLEKLGIAKDFFISKEGRFFIKGTGTDIEYHLRGPRYVIALDSQYSVIQKLDILLEDINDCIEFIKDYSFCQSNQYIELAPILDYLKNSLVTLFNAYIHKEKLGLFNLDNTRYQENRTLFLNSLKIAIYGYYLALADKIDKKTLKSLIEKLDSGIVDKISNAIKNEFRSFIFSSKSVVRPEATHPLILSGFAFNISNKYRNCDFVFGLPSGSTELSCLIHQLITIYYKRKCELLLLPISFHTLKIFEEHKDVNYSSFYKLLKGVNPAITASGVIIDDNSATGKTLEKTKEIIKNYFNNIQLFCAVAEADIFRIKIRLRTSDNNYKYSHPDVYKHSIGVLPVSKIINNKLDLKEIIERRLLFHYYKQKNHENIVDRIVNEVIADSIENKIENSTNHYSKANAILNFKHTFLSNFYGVPITYESRLYSSVEQAYLRQKFDNKVLERLNSKQKRELNEILLIKGIIIQRSNFATAFNDFQLPAGVLKRWSMKLKSWGLEDKAWDSKRLKIMTELLLLKFSHQSLISRLLDTNDKYLIEGNDWNDTFWGVCKNNGRNFLGRLLMNIREKILTGNINNNSQQKI